MLVIFWRSPWTFVMTFEREMEFFFKASAMMEDGMLCHLKWLSLTQTCIALDWKILESPCLISRQIEFLDRSCCLAERIPMALGSPQDATDDGESRLLLAAIV